MSTKSTSSSPVVKLAAVGILSIGFFYLNQGLQTLSQRINELPVQGKAAETAAPAAATATTGPVSRTMHPLLVESNQKAAALRQIAGGAPANLDALFGREAAQKELDEKKRKEQEVEKALQALKNPPATPPANAANAAGAPDAPPVPAVPLVQPPDYFKLLAQRVRVQAVMPDGAVINGGFYGQGEEIKTLGYPTVDGKKMLYPTLESVQGETVFLAEAEGGKRKIKARLAL